MTTPKYRTDTRACSCLGYWWRGSCNHFRAYREAVALVLAQDAFNKSKTPIGTKLAPIGELDTHRLILCDRLADTCNVCMYRWGLIRSDSASVIGSPIPANFVGMVITGSG